MTCHQLISCAAGGKGKWCAHSGRRAAHRMGFLPSSSTQLMLRRLALRALGLPGMYRLLRVSLLGGAGRVP
jgi:hypothetical protein